MKSERQELSKLAKWLGHLKDSVIMKEGHTDDLGVDFICGVCLTTLYGPCTLPCSHSFCLACLKTILDEHGHESLCPYCRAAIPQWIDLKIDTKLATRIA